MFVETCRSLMVILGGIIGIELGLLAIVVTMPDHQLSRELRASVQEYRQLWEGN
jgi:hypothetical protein